ncbi:MULTISPECIES: TRAP transporter substrate-binding protein [Anaerotruncus]|uniref:TRAP transporter substrate-binding protein n=1 Tax=Anaerotruncus TaxID=244127 RepID=UPI000832D565|nr:MULTISPECIES: TRAP transporter substrate-binding protein [Anaerotruncus]
MKTQKTVLAFLLTLCMILTLAGCASPAQPAASNGSAAAPAESETYEWSFGMGGTEETLNYKGAEKFKELIEARSEGRVKVNLYANSSLGSTAEMMEGHINGTIALLTGVTSMLPPYVPGYALFDLPNAFPDIETMRAFLTSDFCDLLNEKYAESGGFVMLGFCDAGFRQLTANKPIHAVADMKGIKIRTQENKYHLAYWNALGANAIAMDWSELYTNLQQGVVDAEENPYMNFYDTKLYEVQKYIMESNHVGHIMTFSMSTSVYNSLPADIRKMVDDCMAESMEYIVGLSDASLQDYKKACMDEGVTIIPMEPEVLAQMQEMASPVYDMVRKDIGDEIVDEFLAAIDKVKK